MPARTGLDKAFTNAGLRGPGKTSEASDPRQWIGTVQFSDRNDGAILKRVLSVQRRGRAGGLARFDPAPAAVKVLEAERAVGMQPEARKICKGSLPQASSSLPA